MKHTTDLEPMARQLLSTLVKQLKLDIADRKIKLLYEDKTIELVSYYLLEVFQDGMQEAILRK